MSPLTGDAMLDSYLRADGGSPLGVGMPPGRPLREDGETHREAWMRIVRADPCSYCGLVGGTLDHIVPRSQGGPGLHNWLNYAGACEGCNRKKGAMSMLDFLMTGSPLARSAKVA